MIETRLSKQRIPHRQPLAIAGLRPLRHLHKRMSLRIRPLRLVYRERSETPLVQNFIQRLAQSVVNFSLRLSLEVAAHAARRAIRESLRPMRCNRRRPWPKLTVFRSATIVARQREFESRRTTQIMLPAAPSVQLVSGRRDVLRLSTTPDRRQPSAERRSKPVSSNLAAQPLNADERNVPQRVPSRSAPRRAGSLRFPNRRNHREHIFRHQLIESRVMSRHVNRWRRRVSQLTTTLSSHFSRRTVQMDRRRTVSNQTVMSQKYRHNVTHELRQKNIRFRESVTHVERHIRPVEVVYRAQQNLTPPEIAPAPVMAEKPPAAVDVNRLSDDVLRKIRKQMFIERERRGLL